MSNTDAVDAAQFLERSRVEVDAYLKTILPKPGTGPDGLHEAMSYSVFAGGKRLRPALAFAAAEAVGGRREAALPFAASLELIHTYSLIHDDLPCMDDDDLRRGKPTSHKVFGEAMAILAGDALHSLAFEALLHHVEEPRLCRALTHTLARAAGVKGMVGGQVEDIAAEGTKPTEEILERIHLGKTAALISAACEGGGRAGGGTAADRLALTAYGRELGLAFQVIDDVLDETGTAQSLGKTPGKDRRGVKATYVALEGVEAARARARRHADAAIAAGAALPAPALLTAIARYVVARDH